MKTSSSLPDTQTWLPADGTLSVVLLNDPLIEALGYDARSAYAEATGAVVISVRGECLLGAGVRGWWPR